jgi:hypothetical protein
MEERIVEIRLDGRAYEARVCDCSDACDDANVYLQEIVEWGRWIRRAEERFMPVPEGRRYRLDAAAILCEPILVRSGLDAATAEAAARQISEQVLDRLLPASSAAEAPEMPGETTMERVARAKAYRLRAVAKLLGELLLDTAGGRVDAVCAACRNEEVMWQVLEAVTSGRERSDHESGKRAGGDGDGGGEDADAGPAAGGTVPGAGDQDGDRAGTDDGDGPRWMLDGAGSAGDRGNGRREAGGQGGEN